MSTITINGRTMDAQAFRDEAISFTDMMAKNARLDEPLPAGQDFSEAEDKELQTQIQAMDILPQEAKSIMWAAFCAKHVSKLARNLCELSSETQPKAFSTHVQILSLLPEAAQEPYYRLFLSSPQSRSLSNLVGNAFARGIMWRRPSGPGCICGLLIELLFWCDPAEGDDKKSPMDASVRRRVARKLASIKANSSFQYLPVVQRADVERLEGVLTVVEQMPEDFYLNSTRNHLLGQVDCCGNEDCGEHPTMRCTRCKSVEYCGKKCQARHWKNGHKVRCFARE
ncbi:zf-MYND domain protein [Rhizoctonia solani AG-3 Rhs1AP]|uniref:Zf-MYND domain protein n=2 Tax=Rhizoctonia solani AG-3 TaxID=1086053 RepID=A0A074S0Y1_9AGAM|nr:zf-MYND domain protein [Rhizoctonia solani AG-3 Rhs1AP]KEP51210.1 zf-MYND domain protein [Rhizoctonia solani 123E]